MSTVYADRDAFIKHILTKIQELHTSLRANSSMFERLIHICFVNFWQNSYEGYPVLRKKFTFKDITELVMVLQQAGKYNDDTVSQTSKEIFRDIFRIIRNAPEREPGDYTINVNSALMLAVGHLYTPSYGQAGPLRPQPQPPEHTPTPPKEAKPEETPSSGEAGRSAPVSDAATKSAEYEALWRRIKPYPPIRKQLADLQQIFS